MADKPERRPPGDQTNPLPATHSGPATHLTNGERAFHPTEGQVAADRARRRAAKAGARAEELRERLANLRARTNASDGPPAPLERSRQAAANALRRRDEAVQRDQAAHEASARAHDRAASAYERRATMVSPDQRAECIHRARNHREAARSTRRDAERQLSTREPGEPPTDTQ
jgi:hypothetical protein